MCNRCSEDPRDQIAHAELALWGLRTLVNHLPVDCGLSAEQLGGLLSLIHDRLDGAADAIQGYVPREFNPKDV